MAKKHWRQGKKRGTFKGGEGGKRPRSGRARVVDPGLFYALRAAVKLLLATYQGRAMEDLAPLISKLETWVKEADAWQTDIPVREFEPEGRQLQRPVAPGEGNSPAVRRATRHVVVPRKEGSPPRWHEPELSAEQEHAVRVVEGK